MAYTLGVPDLGGNLQFSAVQAAEQARQQQAALELRALQQAQEQQQALSLEAYRRAALAQQGANAQRNDQLALADLRLRAQQADRANAAQEQAAAQDAAANARVGTMTDLGHGYRAVLVGPRSAQVIEPERQPWRPDPETLRSLQTAGYLYAPQSERGGSFVPVSTKPAGPPLGTTTDLGAGFRGVVTGPGRMTVVRPERTPKALSSNDAAELKVLDNQIAETEKTVAQYGAGKPDQRTGFLGLFGNTNAEATQAAAAKVEELKSKRTALLSRAGRTVESP
ncbi:MAG: hypothetical protein EBR82_25385, partial [Caulobacteraceae bacterium]|nr:hypothetical protein [Caulobacteraceae bacterium]